MLGAFAAILAMVALASVACGDDEKANSNSDVIAAINILDNAGLHAIADSISKDKTIPATAQSTYQKLQALTLLTDWPEELASQASALAAILGEAAAAVDGQKPDLAKATEAAKKAHDAEHDFSSELWEHLYAEAGLKTGASTHAD